MVARGGIEPPTRGFSVRCLGFSRVLSAKDRRFIGTPSLSRSRSWHTGLRIAVKPEQDRENNRDRGQRHAIDRRGPCSDRWWGFPCVSLRHTWRGGIGLRAWLLHHPIN